MQKCFITVRMRDIEGIMITVPENVKRLMSLGYHFSFASLFRALHTRVYFAAYGWYTPKFSVK